MKKILVIAVLILTIATSVVAGTLAVYHVDLDTMTSGQAIAKNFVLVGKGEDSFKEDIKIAPGDNAIAKTFTVSNFEGNRVCETAMDLNVKVKIHAAPNKAPITALRATVRKQIGENKWETKVEEFNVNEQGEVSFKDEFALSSNKQTYTYSVVIGWPDGDLTDSNNNHISDDAEMADSEKYGNIVDISVSGTQKLNH